MVINYALVAHSKSMVVLQMNLLVFWQIWILFWFMDDIWKIQWFWICWAVSWPRESLNSVFGLFYCVMCRNNKLSAIWNRERSTSANIWKSLPLIRAATSPMCAHHSGLKLKILLGNCWRNKDNCFFLCRISMVVRNEIFLKSEMHESVCKCNELAFCTSKDLNLLTLNI